MSQITNITRKSTEERTKRILAQSRLTDQLHKFPHEVKKEVFKSEAELFKRPVYKPGDGDTRTAIRPGADAFLSLKSVGGRV